MSKFICAGCSSSFFYMEGAMVHCGDCDKPYSAPSKGELNAMRRDRVFDRVSDLMTHYKTMPNLDVFISGVKHRRPSRGGNRKFQEYTENMKKVRWR